MARYEEARGRYKQAVLASLNGAHGDAIRKAIAEFQAARAELARLQPPPPAPARPAAPRSAARTSTRRVAMPAWSLVARLLSAG